MPRLQHSVASRKASKSDGDPTETNGAIDFGGDYDGNLQFSFNIRAGGTGGNGATEVDLTISDTDFESILTWLVARKPGMAEILSRCLVESVCKDQERISRAGTSHRDHVRSVEEELNKLRKSLSSEGVGSSPAVGDPLVKRVEAKLNSLARELRECRAA